MSSTDPAARVRKTHGFAPDIQKYRDTDDKLFMSIEEAISICEALADEVKASGCPIDVVIGIANGALLPTRVIADRLGMPYEFVRYRRRGSTIKRRMGKVPGMRALVAWLYGFKPIARRLRGAIERFNELDTTSASAESARPRLPGAGRVLLVDDAIDSGQSIAIAREQLRERGATDILNLVMTWSDQFDSKANYNVEPEYYLNRRVQHYPWSENNPEFKRYRAWLHDHNLREWN